MPTFAIDSIREIGQTLLMQIRAEIVEIFATRPADLEVIGEALPGSLEKVEPKKIYVGIMIRWAEQAASNINKKAEKNKWEAARQGIEELKKLEEGAQNSKWINLITLCQQYIKCLGKVSDLRSGRATSSFPTISRDEAADAPQGRIHRKALREAKSGERIEAMVAVISETVTNTRTGYTPTVLHWHVDGSPQDNIIFQGTTVLGFVGGHIDREHKQNVITSNNCEARRLDVAGDFIPVAVIGGVLRQLIS